MLSNFCAKTGEVVNILPETSEVLVMTWRDAASARRGSKLKKNAAAKTKLMILLFT